MRLSKDLAFETAYLLAVDVGMQEDIKVIQACLVGIGCEVKVPPGVGIEAYRVMDLRLKACKWCPIFILAVWDEVEI